MKSGFKILLATLLISVMALFFCPLSYAHGSFQSTHGPTSTVNGPDLTGPLAIACLGVVAPILLLQLAQHPDFEISARFLSGTHPLRVLLCVFRC